METRQMNTVCNSDGIQLIKAFEGCKLTSYQDQGGVWTCGWGSTGSDINENTVWTQAFADERFQDDLAVRAEVPLNRLISTQLNENQFSALCSLCYNIGQGNLAKSSARRLINLGQLDDIPFHINLWDEVQGEPNAGLIRRRAAECVLWGTPC